MLSIRNVVSPSLLELIMVNLFRLNISDWFEGVVHDLMKEREKMENMKIEFSLKDLKNGLIK